MCASLAIVVGAACGPAEPPPEEAAPSAAVAPATGPPTARALLALDRQAQEAFFRGDAAHFEGILADEFVLVGPDGGRVDKAASLAWIGGLRCEVRDGWAVDDPLLSPIDADTYVLTYRGTFDGTCTTAGEARRIPGAVRAATVWVRRGGKWQAAFHGENPIHDPEAPAAPAPEPAAGAATPGAGAAAAVPHPETDAMMAVEAAVWEAWRVHDAAKLAELTAKELAFVDIFGNATNGKVGTLDLWDAHECEIQSSRLVDGLATPISATVALLTFRGILEGTCDGLSLPAIHGNSVYVKEGDAWRLTFTLNHLPES